MIKIGETVPSVTFKTRQKEGDDFVWKDVTTAEIFDGKTVVIFSLPGAFTPTCSSTHLPGYMANSAAIKAEGVDEIYCLSVNDTFVMNAWAKDQMLDDELSVIPDGNGEFSAGMGTLEDFSHLGFGPRSWRYSAVITNGVVEKMFVEDQTAPGDPFEVSDSETMLAYLKERNAKAA